MSLQSRRFVRPLVAFALSAGLVLAAVSALADRPSSDRTTTTQILAQLTTDAGASPSSLVRPIKEARAALARADNAISTGDVAGARLLEGLAREWAEVALDLSRASQAQADAGALQQAAADGSLRVERARAMLDELAARKSRAQGELNQFINQADAAAAKPPSTSKAVARPLAKAPPPARAPARGAPAPRVPSKKGGGQ
jgi:hypothetical protein